MKRFGKVLGLAVLTAAAAVFMGCPTPNNNTNEETIWEGAEIIESLANVTVDWTQGSENVENGAISKEYASRLNVGSKVIFEIEQFGEYIQFQVNAGDTGWEDCGVNKYYNAKGVEVNVVEAKNSEGKLQGYKTDEGAVSSGIYYFIVTEENLDKLRNGFYIHGHFILKKIGITNLGATVEDPDDNIELTKPADKTGYFTFWAQSSGAKTGSVMFILNYESSVLDESVTLSNVDIEYIINDEEAKHYTKDITLPKNEWGSDYQAKVDLFNNVKIIKNDAVYIKITANVNNENAVSIIQGNLIDTDSSVGYWKEMCIEEQQKQILSGITFKESSDNTGGGY